MSIELYWGSGSTPAWRVILALTLKGLPWTSHLLSFAARETRSPEFLAINPRGKVPTLQDGDVVVNESIAILAYLDRAYPHRPLFGATPAEAAQVWRFVLEYESHGHPAISAVSRPLLFGPLEPGGDAVRQALPALYAELDLLADRISRSPDGAGPLVGTSLSAADLVWFCGIQQLVRAATRPAAATLDLGIWPLGDRWPAIVAWAGQIEAIAGYDATRPPHWADGEHPAPSRLR
ncbi:MAG: glutathione S-transferase family protein [Myxococcales bacterium]|nr:glutathione S-transferase family protein [Myxococcales bacterium]